MSSSSKRSIEQVWYSCADLCRYFGVNKTTILRWRYHRNFPQPENQHLGRPRYDIRKVQRFLDQRL
ncbi:hypothetical protein D5018_16485 [Parashewanella curva]|uniref:DNA-binding protein n=1 Tax=Parashewanella curva TaxID=2338552 RepID=A0A3L8PT62_9GAMM|nr:hypothetical protein [Parashewanella curva]RLV58617.1 hypothetical protein D5018_16485 [Parashewanella curva]